MDQIEAGELVPGTRLPPIWMLARQLDVNPMTVAKVYKNLAEQGFVESRAWRQTLPIFSCRAFRHAALHLRTDSPLQKPIDLPSKRFGVSDFSMTAAVWMRGILSEPSGVLWSDLHWVVSRSQRFPHSPGVTIAHLKGDLGDALIASAINVRPPPLVSAHP